MKRYDDFDLDEPANDDLFALSDAIGPRRRNGRADVLKVETLLANTGDHDLEDGPTGYPGAGLDAAVRAYQKRRGLAVDGVLEPEGETIAALDRDLRPRLAGFRAPTEDEADDHHNRLGRGEEPLLMVLRDPPALHDIPDLPEIDAVTYQSNGRTARALFQTKDNGALADLVASAIEDGGRSAVAEARDLIEQIRDRDPRRADQMARAVFDRLSDSGRQRFAGGEQPEHGPIGVVRREAARGEAVEQRRGAEGGIGAAKDGGGIGPDKAEYDDNGDEPDGPGGDGPVTIAQAGNAPPSSRTPPPVATPAAPVALPLLEPPVEGMRPRTGDPTGIGRYGPGLRRDDNNNPRPHNGIDLEVAPGKPVMAPISGHVTQRGDVYHKDKFGRDINRGLKYVDIEGTGEYTGMVVRILYVAPNALGKGAQVVAGKTVVGSSQDPRQSPKNPAAMHPHIHVEVKHAGRQVDPTPLLFPAWP